jgi:hypothetical protein
MQAELFDILPGGAAEIGTALVNAVGAQAAPFDYTGLDPALAACMRATSDGVRQVERKVFGMAVAAGLKLQQVKEQLPHGTFLRWLVAEQINPRSAQNYMNAARA